MIPSPKKTLPLNLLSFTFVLQSLSREHEHGSFSDRYARPSERDSAYYSFVSDWNSHNDFFKFTRGRFIVDEAENARKREIRFDMNSLARVAAQSVGAARCIAIEKYPDGMFNKAFLMTMDNGQEVIAKIPNPNAGIPHSTTASEVATMDFVSSS